MATFSAGSDPKPIEINKFLGLNTSLSETELKIGECTYLRNFRLTNNYKPEKRLGHKTFKDFANSKPCYGHWYGTLGSKTVLLTTNDGKLREYNFGTALWSDVGTIAEAQTSMMYFNGKVYILNGSQYKEYDGTTYQDVVPYVPTIAIGTPPTGGGTLFEEINLLTGEKKQQFVATAGVTEFTLAEQNIDANPVTATVNGAAKVETTNFTVNRTTGKVTFLVPMVGNEIVIIDWFKVVSGNADLIKKHKYMIKFGPSNDTNVFIWGNADEKNTYRVSGTFKPNYFPAGSFYKVSDNEYAVTNLQPQYDRLLVFKENRTHYTYAQVNPLYAANSGLNKYIYPSFDLNDVVGNQVFNSCQLIDNSPVSIMSNSIYKWSNTSIEDERNANIISTRIEETLNDINMTGAVTFDNQKQNELWVNVGSMVYIYNYGNDTWYEYDNITATWFDVINDQIYYGSNGKIERFEGLNDNGVAIMAKGKTGFMDFGLYEYFKTTTNAWVSIAPASRTSVKMKFPTNRKNESDPKLKTFTEGYKLFDFESLDFEDWSFETNRNPQVFRIKPKAKGYTTIQVVFWNDELNETLLFNGIKLPVETNSFSK